MKYFLDTEFIDTGKSICLISIGIVREDGKSFYQINRNINLSLADTWLVHNVYPHLPVEHYPGHGWNWKNSDKDVGQQYAWDRVDVSAYEIRDRLVKFTQDDPEVQFWAYYGAYDWVATCQLFGRLLDIPKNWKKYYMDVKQFAEMRKIKVELPKQTTPEHNALNDAYWTKKAYEFLVKL